jgi:Protein of unknown function (DUF1573)
MKKLLCSVALFAGILFTGHAFAQEKAVNPNAAVMKFEHDTIDYGTIPHNADGYRSFKFTNVGKEPLIITDAHGSCGCTVPTAPKEPIQPGQQSEIKVHYATDRVGMFIKNVTLTTNANPPTKVLTIKGNVLPDENANKPGTSPAHATQVAPNTGH